MPNRPREHELETLSRRAFESVLPSKWVCRSKDFDYGIDAEVEVFDEKGSATGLVFLVQLKGTDEKNEGKARAVTLKQETIRYFFSLSVPVLVVRYVAATSRLYAKWCHDLSRIRPRGKKTLTFYMQDSTLLPTRTTTSALASKVRLFRRIREGQLTLPIEFGVRRNDSALRGTEREAFRRAFAPYSSVLRFNASHSAGVDCFVDLEENEASISIGGVLGASVHYTTNTVPEPGLLAGRLAFGLGLVTAGSAHLHIGTPLLAATPTSVLARAEPADAMAAVRYLLRNRDTRAALELLKRADAAGNQPATTVMMAVLFDPAAAQLPGHRGLLVDFHRERLKRVRGTLEEATAWYNLGNSLSQLSPREALTCYRKARRLDGKYGARDYWWREVAGTLHNLGKFRRAAGCYARAIEIGGQDQNCVARLADSLMFAGEYAGASSSFECAASIGSLEPEWVLKGWLVNMFQRRGLTRQTRDRTAGARGAVPKEGAPSEQAMVELKDAIAKDALCNLPWFNLGVLENSAERRHSSAEAFLAAAILWPLDAEAWMNVTLLCLGEPDFLPLLPYVLLEANRCAGNEYIDSLFARAKGMSLEHAELFTELVAGIPDLMPSKEPAAHLRILGRRETTVLQIDEQGGRLIDSQVPGAPHTPAGAPATRKTRRPLKTKNKRSTSKQNKNLK